jgi:uncharacterized caspase-like protein
MPKLKFTGDILSAALEGFAAQTNRIDTRIAEIRQMLDGEGSAQAEAAKPKRRVSAAARRRMAKAQRLRWKKIKQASDQPVTPKRTMSASARKRIAAVQKKRWAIKKAS